MDRGCSHVTRTLAMPSSPSFHFCRSLLLLLIVISLPWITDGCLKRAASPPEPAEPLEPFNSTENATSEAGSTHRLPCLPTELDSVDCLHGGTCFAVLQLYSGQRLASCKCTSEWIGTKCEQRYFDPETWESLQSMATIVLPLLIFAVVFMTVLIIGVCVYLRIKGKKSLSQRQENPIASEKHEPC